jgi:acetaldehyde dehydrogenase
MRDTVYCEVKQMDTEKITRSIEEMAETVRQYVPGYRLKQAPLFDENHVTVFIEVEGAGDYFPVYAGNLDIMTAAATRTAENFARHLLNQRNAQNV